MKKGYFVHYGYMGWIENHYMLFTTEQEYGEYFETHSAHKTKGRAAYENQSHAMRGTKGKKHYKSLLG